MFIDLFNVIIKHSLEQSKKNLASCLAIVVLQVLENVKLKGWLLTWFFALFDLFHFKGILLVLDKALEVLFDLILHFFICNFFNWSLLSVIATVVATISVSVTTHVFVVTVTVASFLLRLSVTVFLLVLLVPLSVATSSIVSFSVVVSVTSLTVVAISVVTMSSISFLLGLLVLVFLDHFRLELSLSFWSLIVDLLRLGPAAVFVSKHVFDQKLESV